MLHTLESQNLAQAELNDHQQSRIAALTSQIDALNASMREAVDAGLTIELRRSSRHHQEDGHWGDIIAPSVMKRD